MDFSLHCRRLRAEWEGPAVVTHWAALPPPQQCHHFLLHPPPLGILYIAPCSSTAPPWPFVRKYGCEDPPDLMYRREGPLCSTPGYHPISFILLSSTVKVLHVILWWHLWNESYSYQLATPLKAAQRPFPLWSLCIKRGWSILRVELMPSSKLNDNSANPIICVIGKSASHFKMSQVFHFLWSWKPGASNSEHNRNILGAIIAP